MALANFFDKISLSASQRIQSFDRTSFEQKLLSHCVGIYFATNSIETSEGRWGLDLAIRILARLYPNMKFVDFANNEESKQYLDALKDTARKINPAINLDEDAVPTIILIVGELNCFESNVPVIHVGSKNWTAYYSIHTSKDCSNSNNPFGISYHLHKGVKLV